MMPQQYPSKGVGNESGSWRNRMPVRKSDAGAGLLVLVSFQSLVTTIQSLATFHDRRRLLAADADDSQWVPIQSALLLPLRVS